MAGLQIAYKATLKSGSSQAAKAALNRLCPIGHANASLVVAKPMQLLKAIPLMA